jgi:O-antigen/teichoic acid export membrane protein
MGAEPFFFKQAAGQEPQKTYARVLKFFVLVLSVMFLVVSLFLPIWSHLIGPAYRSAIGIVPILLLANIFLGIYYNLSIWFKLTGKTTAGSYITLIGTAITIVLNFIFIPYFGFIASAWATFFCYGTMMLTSYIWGQKVYPVPYPAKKIVAYLIIAVLVYILHKTISIYVVDFWWQTISGAALLIGYLLFVARIEKKELEKIFLWQKT